MFIPVTLCVWLRNSFQTNSTEVQPFHGTVRAKWLVPTIPHHTYCWGLWGPIPISWNTYVPFWITFSCCMYGMEK